MSCFAETQAGTFAIYLGSGEGPDPLEFGQKEIRRSGGGLAKVIVRLVKAPGKDKAQTFARGGAETRLKVEALADRKTTWAGELMGHVEEPGRQGIMTFVTFKASVEDRIF